MIAVARVAGDPWAAFWVGFIVIVALLAERYLLPWLDRYARRYDRRHHARRIVSPTRRPAGRRTHGPGPGDMSPVPQPVSQAAATEPVSDAQPAAPFDLSAEPGSTFRA